MTKPEPMARVCRCGLLPKLSLKYRSKGEPSPNGLDISAGPDSVRWVLTLTTAGLSSRPILTQSGACTVGIGAFAACSVHSGGVVPLVKTNPVVTPRPVVIPPTASPARRASAGQPHFACLLNQSFICHSPRVWSELLLLHSKQARCYERGMERGGEGS